MLYAQQRTPNPSMIRETQMRFDDAQNSEVRGMRSTNSDKQVAGNKEGRYQEGPNGLER